MNRALVSVCIILVLAVAGGIVYVQFIYLPKMASQVVGTVPVPVVPTSPSSTVQATSTVTAQPTSTVPTAASAPKNCDGDVNCLVAAATNNCSPASGSYVFQYVTPQQGNQTSGISIVPPGTTFTLDVSYQIKGPAGGGQCSIYKDIAGVSAQASQSLIQQSLAQGMTMAQFDQQLAAFNNLISVPKDFYGTCDFTASGLAADIAQLKSGGLSGETSISMTLTSGTTTGGTVRDVCHNYFKN